MSLDPRELDATAINDAGEFEMMLFDDAEWDDTQEHQRQLQVKLAAYMDAARNKAEAKGRKIRITVVGMYPPDNAGSEFLSRTSAVVESAGMAFHYELQAVSDSDW
jgi:hypothetical protein